MDHNSSGSKFIMLALATLVIWAIPALALAQDSLIDPPVLELATGWQYRWGDSPLDEAGLRTWLADPAGSPDWQSLDQVERLNERSSKILWMRRPLPAGQWRDPALFFDSVDQGLEVYLGHTLIYKAGLVDRTGSEPALGTTHHLIVLPPDFAGQMLTLRFYSQYNTIGPRTGLYIGSRSDHLLNILYVDIDRFILANLLLVISVGAIAFFLTNRGEKAFLGMAIFSASAGLFILFRTQLVELFTINIFLQEYCKIGSVFFLPVGLALFFDQIIGPGPGQIVRRLWQIHLVYAVAALTLSLLGLIQLLNTVLPYEVLIFITLITIIAISARESLHGNIDAQLFTVGYSLVLVFGLLEIFDDIGLIDLPRRVIHWGIFGFVIILLLIMLRRYKQAVEARTQLTNIQRELKTAHQIQQNLLPPPRPPWSSPDVVCYTAPAREMGGDLYAYHAFDDRHFALVVGDVSGKGMPAALLMGVSLSSLRANMDRAFDPGNLLVCLDRIIAPYTRATHQNCALCYIDLILNGETARLRAANAGCIAPVIKRADGRIEWINVGGIPLGVGLGAQSGYPEATATLTLGDALIMVSDGIIEAQNNHRELFGFHRFEQVIANAPAANAEMLLDRIKVSVADFVGHTDAHDDMTVVVLQI